MAQDSFNSLISIIVPVYNVRPFLEKSVGSICQQSYRNLEIIVVDDGSTDGSSELCDEIAARDPRIQVIHQANAGVSMARNAGVSAAVGDFIGFVDPDDWVDSDMYETLVRLWQKHQADICVCGICHENADGNELRKSPSPPHEIALNREEALTLLSDDKLLKSYLCNKLFRRELFNGIRFPQGRTFEDVAVMHLLVARAQRVVVTPDCKYHYVIRKGSITDLRYKPVKEYDYFFSMYERACFFADAEQAPAAIGAFLKKAVRFADHLFLAANTSQHKAMLNEVLAKMHEFDSCRIQLSVGLRAKRMLLYYCLPLYRAGYRLTKGLLR